LIIITKGIHAHTHIKKAISIGSRAPGCKSYGFGLALGSTFAAPICDNQKNPAPPAFSSDKAQPTDPSNMDTLRENGADKVLLSMLESAFGDGDELKIA